MAIAKWLYLPRKKAVAMSSLYGKLTAVPTVEEHVDRKAQMGTRVLINYGRYYAAKRPLLFVDLKADLTRDF